jgi:hypothetical protein
MRTLITKSIAGLAVVSMIAVASAFAPPVRVTLGVGSVIPVTLDQNLSSDHSMKGDTFTATVKSGYAGLPNGTRVEGIVRNAVLKTKTKPGVLVLEFTRIISPNQAGTAIDGSPVGLDSKSVSTGSNGRLTARNGVKNKRLTYVGYGAGAGALYSLLGGGKRIVQDTVIGAALGYLGGSLEKGGQNKVNNVLLKSGNAMGVLLHKSAIVRY